MINLDSLKSVLETLDEIIIRYDKESYDDAIRDAVIQRFEYTYSLAVKTIMRFLALSMPETTENPTFNDAIREANRLGLLLSGLDKWTIFREKRNMSSHTYDKDIALKVVAVTKDFSKEIHFLLEKLNKKL